MPKEFFISVAKKDFRLVEAFEIVSESGIAVESEEVFILLSAKALKFFIRKIKKSQSALKKFRYKRICLKIPLDEIGSKYDL